MSLFTRTPPLGVDIGTTAIKVADVGRGREGLTLQNYGILETMGYLERANSALQSSTMKLSENEVAGELALLLERMGVRPRDAIFSVPSFAAFTTLIEIPASSERELASIMQFQAKQYVPLPLTEVTLDWQKVGEIGEGNGAKSQVLLVAILNEQISRYRGICARARLTLRGVEVEGMALARALGGEAKAPVLVIDVGARSTMFLVVVGGSPRFMGQTDFSGGSLTQSLANGLNIGMRRAEQVKRQRGLMGAGGERELSTLMEVILDVIIREAARVKAKYEEAYGGQIAGAVLSGGGANLPGILAYMGSAIELPVRMADPFARVALPATLAAQRESLGAHLAVAIGLALKGTG